MTAPASPGLTRQEAFAKDLHLQMLHHRHESPALMATWVQLHKNRMLAIQAKKEREAARIERKKREAQARQEKFGIDPPVMLNEIWGGIEETSDALCARKAELALRRARNKGYSASRSLSLREEAYAKERIRCDKVKRAFSAVARIHGVTVSELIADFGSRNLMPIRYLAWHRAMVKSGYSTSVIGKFANRCRTTITYGIKTHCKNNNLPYPGVRGKR